MTHLKHKYNLQVEDILTFSKERLKDHCYKKWKAAVNEDYLLSAKIVKELIMIKDNIYSALPFLTMLGIFLQISF